MQCVQVRSRAVVIPLVSLMLALSSCATIFVGSKQQFDLASNPPDAKVTVKAMSAADALLFQARAIGAAGGPAGVEPAALADKQDVGTYQAPSKIDLPRPGSDFAMRGYGFIFEKDGCEPSVKIMTGYKLNPGTLVLVILDSFTFVPLIVDFVSGVTLFDWDPPMMSATLTSRTALASSPIADRAGTGVVTAKELTIRGGAATTKTALKSLAKGDRVTILDLDTVPGWYQVESSDGTKGWVLSNYIKLAP